MLLKKCTLFIFCFSLCSVFLFGQNAYFFPTGTSFSPDVPSPSQFLGYNVGDFHTRHDRMVSYFQELARVSDRANFEIIGYTNEYRPQVVLTITKPEHHDSLERIRENQLANADPTQSPTTMEDQPIVVLLGYNVHGNEPSGMEAAMLMAYYLIGSQSEEVQTFLDNAVVFIDPNFNPDGRDRHTHWANMHKAKNLSADPLDREHNEGWPRGRTNHYWFDLNRDWLPLAQIESRNRIKFYHNWLPNVVTDYHEMGTNATYFFEPTKPFGSENPIVPRSNYDGLNNLFAKYYAEALDEIGSLYFTKELFDNSYPGYGSTYPDMHGGLGMVFEQASSRGHLQNTTTEPITFAFTIRNHLRTSIATVKASVENRKQLQEHQRTFFKEALAEGKKAQTKYYVFGDLDDPGRTKAFVNLLLQHRIKTYPLSKDVIVGNAAFKAGQSFVVPGGQQQYKMVQTFFEPVTTFYDSVFYDASAWTVALAFGMPYAKYSQELALDKEIQVIEDLNAPIEQVEQSDYAYLFNWNDYFAPKALNYLLSKGVHAKVAHKSGRVATSNGETDFGYGAIVIPVADQGMDAEALYEYIRKASALTDIKIHSVLSGFSLRGIDLGSRNFVTISKPQVAMLIGSDVSSYEAGEVWHLLDTRFDMAFSKIDIGNFNQVDLNQYNTLVLVSGQYGNLSESSVQKIKDWTANGGTLILQRQAIPWGISKGLITEKLAKKPANSLDGPGKRYDYVTALERRGALRIGGSVYAATLDPTHPLGYGYSDRSIYLYRNHSIFLEPSQNPYSTVIQYTDNPLMDGYVHEDNLERLKNTPGLMVSRVGRGRAVLFIDNPNFRGFWYGTNKLFMNALFFGDQIRIP